MVNYSKIKKGAYNMLTCEEHVTYSEEDGLLRFAMFYLDGKQFLDGGEK